MSKLKIENYPYIEVPEVNKYLLDFMMLQLVPIDSLKDMVSSEKKLERQLNQLNDEKDQDDIQYLLSLSELMGSHYNFYNGLANILFNRLWSTLKEKLEEFLNFEDVEEACEWLFETDDEEIVLPDAEICEWVTLLRLYKKGKIADKYIPSMLESASWLFYLETSLNIEDFTDQEDWKIEIFNKYLENQVPLPFDLDQVDESLSFSDYKEQIVSLLELMEESVESVDPETLKKLETENEKLQTERNQFESDLAEANKKLKNKDSQIQKLQREVASVSKSEEALQKKYEELKKQYGARDSEIGQLRKDLQELKKYLDTTEKSLNRLKDEQKTSIQKAEKSLQNYYNSELAKLQLTLDSEMSKLAAENEHLTKQLESVQEQVIEVDQMQLDTYVNEIDELKLLVEKLQNENHTLKKQVQEGQQSIETNDDEVLIDPDLMDDLLFTKPNSDDGQGSKSAPVMEEDDFSYLFGDENKPK